MSATAVANTRSHCRHCGGDAYGAEYCCSGCQAAAEVIGGLGLGDYYARRTLDASARAMRPLGDGLADPERFVEHLPDGSCRLRLGLDGVQCGACVWLIESVLAREAGLASGRVNMTTRRLALLWKGAEADATRFVRRVESLGYRLVPATASAQAAADDEAGRVLMRAMAVAGFAAVNVMLMSIGTWAGVTEHMGPATRGLMHWWSAMLALPAIAYSIQPFARPAFRALLHGRTNMDVPITLGVLLVAGISLFETLKGREHAYFDSAVTLLFFLLIGRVLDHRARGAARATVMQLLALRAENVTLIEAGGTRRVSAEQVTPGALLSVGMGERIGVDGVVERGESQIDASLVTGESKAAGVRPGARVFAGTLNLGDPITVRAMATGDATLLAESVRLIEAAEGRRGRYVVLADKVARYYAPVVHLAALSAFLVLFFLVQAGMERSILVAVSVLLVTCPCALALAVPAVQVIASSRLQQAGSLLKSPTALERLATITGVMFDKTGTLTEPALAAGDYDEEDLRLAASMALGSNHPLARVLAAACPQARPVVGLREIKGAGLVAGEARLGSRAFCGVELGAPAEQAELILTRPGFAPVRFGFAESLRPGAMELMRWLRAKGLRIFLASGDQALAVARVAGELGIGEFRADLRPADKLAWIEALRADGARILMVGDGLNDGPCLAAADISASPAHAADISQTLADLVYRDESLAAVAQFIAVARRARSVMRQNLMLALGYNLLFVPVAAMGMLTPWVAAIAMSCSSLTVIANSFRVSGGIRQWS
jgi:Cu2+-exporting ATPase